MENRLPTDGLETDLTEDELDNLAESREKMLERDGINVDDVLKQARNALDNWATYFSDNITTGKFDLKFTVQDQWTPQEKAAFTQLFKPAMTFNKLRGTVTKILGEQRKEKPDLQVRSLTGKASQQDINLRADLVRTISYQSSNDLVYQAAYRNALTVGWGAYYLSIEYETPTSNRRIVKFNTIPDIMRTFFDPRATEPHKGDGNYCGLLHVFSREEFLATYPWAPNAKSFRDPNALMSLKWDSKDAVCLAEFYVKEWYSTTLYKLSDGRDVTKEEWELLEKNFKAQKEITKDALVIGDLIKNNFPKIIATRVTKNYRIMRYILAQDDILDWEEWPSKYLPIIFVDGNSCYLEGKQYTNSFVHDAIDAQRSLNYVLSETMSEIKNRRREQWLATRSNIENEELMWKNPETQLGALIAKPDVVTGAMPQKMPAWEISQGLLANMQAASQNIREILGFSETEQLQGRDISGTARKERKAEGAMSCYIYRDNLNQSIAQGGRIVLDLLPVVYAEQDRPIVLSKADGQTQNVLLNQMMDTGEMANALFKGDYDIEIDAGPSFAVQKEIALEFFMQTIQAYPQVFPLIADLWAKNLDIQYMPQMVERLKNIVPPEIIAKENGQPPPPQQPNPQEAFMKQEFALKQQQLQERAAELKIRQENAQLEKEKHELEKMKLDLEVKQMQIDAHLQGQKLHVEREKSDLGFTKDMAKIIADAHR